MDNDLILTSVASYLTNFEIFTIYRQLCAASRHMWRGLLGDRAMPSRDDVFEVFKSALTRNEWIEFLLVYVLTNTTYLPSVNGDTIVHKCARRGDVFSVYLLLHVGVADFDPNSPGSGGMTVLHCAAACSDSSKSIRLCQLLTKSSCDVSVRDDIGRLAEDWANKQHSFDVAELLRTRRLPPSVGCFPFLSN